MNKIQSVTDWLRIIGQFSPGFDMTGEGLPIPDGHIRFPPDSRNEWARQFELTTVEINGKTVELIRGIIPQMQLTEA